MVHVHDMGTSGAVDDAGPVFALEGAESFQELDHVCFVGGVAACGAPVGVIECASL